MRKLVLVFGILAGVVSVGECIEAENKISAEDIVGCIAEEYNKCQKIVNSGGIPPAYECEKSNVCTLGAIAFKVLGDKDKEAQYAEKIISLNPALLQRDLVVIAIRDIDANIAQSILGGTYFRLVEYYRAKNDGENFVRIAAEGCGRAVGMSEEYLPFLCNWTGTVLTEAKMYHEARTLFKKVCDLNLKSKFSEMLSGSGDGCFLLAYLYVEGKGVRQDYVKIVELLKKGCDLDSSNSCLLLGDSYLKGQGVVKNHSIAKRFFGKGCDLGSQDACNEYRKLNQTGGVQ